MKILMVSMSSIHLFRWAEQLKESGHEVYWFDVYDNGSAVKRIDWVQQIVGWKRRWDFPGRFFIKKRVPFLYHWIVKVNDRDITKEFERHLKIIQPDIVQSFEMFSSCMPILAVMKKYPKIKWVYSVWGNDMFFFKNKTKHFDAFKEILPHFSFMFADCTRDYDIAKDLGFIGEYLGTYPTGGGYDLKIYESFKLPERERNLILIKGYQHEFGRCNTVLSALSLLKEELKGYKIMVYAANKVVTEHARALNLQEWNNLDILENINHEQLLKLKGEAIICIGNSISDGMPNTLLEAILMDAFPIQSNPGGATEEIIIDGLNGLLIHQPEDEKHIAEVILKAVDAKEFVSNAITYNREHIRPKLDRRYIQECVLEQYSIIEKNLK